LLAWIKVFIYYAPMVIEQATRLPHLKILKIVIKDLSNKRHVMELENRGREVLAARLTEWMGGHVELYNQKRLADKAGIGQTTIGRILHKQVSATVDIIERIADTFGRDMGELLRDNASFGGINYERDRYAKLPDYERARVEAFIKHVIAEHEYRAAQEDIAKATDIAKASEARRVRRTGPNPTLEPQPPAAKRAARKKA
jgi:transcriptional regulator with XRE-family HTH domain